MKRFTVPSVLCVLAFACAVYAAEPTKAAGSTSSTTTETTHHHSSKTPPIDLNSAPKESLTKLPGVTDEIADKIIAARPFKSKGELTSKGILSKDAYSKIQSHVTVKSTSAAKTK